MMRRVVAPRRRPEDLRQDRAFWAGLLEQRDRSGELPPHTAGGYRNRRFAIVRDAAWITLYRAMLPYPQIGVFLRCTGPAGEAFFMLADQARDRIECRLRDGLGPGAELEWGGSHHPGMIDVAAVIAAACPWDDAAAGLHIAWLLRTGALWWRCFAALGDGGGG
ncbi:MAG TPA: hypothetical protein VGG99_00895 [Acetobacteraceae bacterium]|jgi:hypothetical protein